MSVRSINPTNEEEIETFEPHTPAEIDTAISRADDRFKSWRLTRFEERAKLMRAAADVLEARAAEFARHMTLEMGKPISQAEAEAKKCAWVCRHYADNAEAYLEDEPIETDASSSYVRNLPIGPVLAVMPWNFPLWQVFRFAAPSLMAGNVGLLKHASNVWRCALDIEQIFTSAGFPEGCFQTLLIGSDKVEGILKDDRVRAATLTGSGPAGSSVASIAGSEIKPTVLELGGTDAFIVMPSADLEDAVETAVDGRTQNNGQSCIAAKRFFVHADIYDAFKEKFVAAMGDLKIGDPLDKDTQIGPLAMKSIYDDLKDQTERSIKKGARPLIETQGMPDRGYWFAPQILEDAPDGSPAAEEEMFGPVASLWKVNSLDDAIARTNKSPFGLGSAIFTNDKSEIDNAIRDLEAGSTFVNAKVASDPRLPFGGVKKSGYGRELSRDGILAFVNRKTVSIA
ncbi:MAG: NAD-dependent succinate-semialdehyde dehydrogenase [Henriciella sp.]|uniref:NAD-dependent succinate-semialdehyde dehydrogenase n=1 Tax=Henriciella sp. TaxID=1968823 RepID=UPI003C7957D9